MTYEQFNELLQNPLAVTIISILILWSWVWKILALYRAGANRSPVWFVVLMFVNTIGILDLLYLLIFSRKRKREVDARLGLLP